VRRVRCSWQLPTILLWACDCMHFQQTHIFYQFILPAILEWILEKKKSSTNSKHDKNSWTYIVWHAQLLYMVLLLVLVSILNDQWEWSWGTSTKFLQCMNISNLVFSLARKLFRSCVWSCTNPFWARGVWILDKIVKKNKENFHCIK
jgi:hypothetical protein